MFEIGRRLQSILCAGVVSVAMSSVAYASDPTPRDYRYNWTGFYVGAHAGLANGQTTGAADLGIFSVNTDYSVDGALYGGHVGYNFQINPNVVVGIEGTLSAAEINGSTTCVVFLNCRREVDWLATVAGRIGYAMDRTMVYALGGVAWGDVNTDVRDNIVNGGFIRLSGGETHVGWVLGFGIEQALSSNIRARIEYTHIDLGNETHNLGLTFLGVPVPGASLPSRVNLEIDAIKLGVSIAFN